MESTNTARFSHGDNVPALFVPADAAQTAAATNSAVTLILKLLTLIVNWAGSPTFAIDFTDVLTIFGSLTPSLNYAESIPRAAWVRSVWQGFVNVTLGQGLGKSRVIRVFVANQLLMPLVDLKY
jgi:hypothetical protein